MHQAIQLAFQDRSKFTIGSLVACEASQCGSQDNKATCLAHTHYGVNCDYMKTQYPAQECRVFETIHAFDCWGCTKCGAAYMNHVYAETVAERTLIFTGQSMLSNYCNQAVSL
jgi:hypothetical protein